MNNLEKLTSIHSKLMWLKSNSERRLHDLNNPRSKELIDESLWKIFVIEAQLALDVASKGIEDVFALIDTILDVK
jgi:hypothetical protein